MPPDSSYKSTLRPEDFAPQPGFRISIVSIIVYLAGVAVHLFLYDGKDRVQHGGPITYVAIGGYVGIFLIALLVSFFAFAGTRSRVVSTLFFCLSVPALVFGDMKVNALTDAKVLPPVAQAKPTPAPAATPVIPGNPTYSVAQREKYYTQANDAFVAARTEKIKEFTDAFNALKTSGGVSPVGLTSKEAIAERRKLVAALDAANNGYIDFITNQEALYRTELQKTPLIPNDVNNNVSRFMTANSNVPQRLAVRQTQKDLLKANDDILAALDRMSGRWRLKGDKALFQNKADNDQYGKLLDEYNAAAVAQNAALAKLNATGAGASVGATPDATAGAEADASKAAAAASPAPPSPSATQPTPGASAAPVVTPVGTPASAVKPTP